jgi:hypothetical protein
MNISERLQNRLENFTKESMQNPIQVASTMNMVEDPKGVISNKEMEMFMDSMPGAASKRDQDMMRIMDMVGPTKGAISNREMEMFMDASPSMSDDLEERETLMQLLQKQQIKEVAPFSDVAKDLAMLGTGEDTQLVHARPGEVVIPPEMLEDEEFESMLEQKFNQFNIDPESAVVGVGIASLNESTGLEEFGFFKKIGKKLGKVVKKVAPIAAFVPGVGTALGGVLGGIGGLAAKIPVIGPALGQAGSTIAGGIANLGIPGVSQIAKGTTGGFGNIGKGLGSLEGLLGDGPLSGFLGGGQEVASFDIKSAQLDPKTNMFIDAAGNSVDPATYRKYISDPSLVPTTKVGGGNFNLGRAILGGPGRTPDIIKAGEDILKGEFEPVGQGTKERGGLGMLGNLGIGALAATLGKLAYDETKKDQGVPLTPLTTMDATGRYNIEAEIARRMGLPQPNPIEFGLLPEGTLPELTGGKPRGMYMGGIAAFAQGGAVAMQEGGEMNPNDFPRMDGDINGPGTETSDDIPAMLSDGEFVMTGRAVRGAGSFDMKNEGGIVTLIPTTEESRERGTDLMYKMMDVFEGQASGSS